MGGRREGFSRGLRGLLKIFELYQSTKNYFLSLQSSPDFLPVVPEPRTACRTCEQGVHVSLPADMIRVGYRTDTSRDQSRVIIIYIALRQ